VTAIRIVAAALACSLVLSTFASAAAASVPPDYASTLIAAAQRIERAAKAGAPVPAMHIPPAPLGGPPRFSPSLDDWLQRSLEAARDIGDDRDHSSIFDPCRTEDGQCP